MTKEELEDLVLNEYNKLNVESARRQMQYLPSNQIKALINIIAPLLKDIRELKELIHRGY